MSKKEAEATLIKHYQKICENNIKLCLDQLDDINELLETIKEKVEGKELT